MGPGAVVHFVLFLVVVVGVGGSVVAVPSGRPSPAATSFTLQVLMDLSAADRNDTIASTVWLNVTGGGQLQVARVNLSLEPDLSVNGATGYPADCGVVSSSATFVEWQCGFLRSGRSYPFTIPVVVDATAQHGRYRNATAQAVELGAGAAAPRTSVANVWVLRDVLELQVSAEPAGPVLPGAAIHFLVNVTNVFPLDQTTPQNEPNVTAYLVRITIGISPFLDAGSTPRFIALDNLTPSENQVVNFTGIVQERAPAGGAVWINATVLYRDIANRSIGPKFEERAVPIASAAIQPDARLILAITAFALLAIVAAILVVPAIGERKLEIDEVFLMHRSGILIQHLNRGPGLRKDDDLVASMFVAIQEFVRDSFDTKATLDEISFGGRKAAVLRGKNVSLAALISKGSPWYLFPQMTAVERDLEKAHGALLADWDGRVSRLERAGPILESFLRGGYRRFRGWPRR